MEQLKKTLFSFIWFGSLYAATGRTPGTHDWVAQVHLGGPAALRECAYRCDDLLKNGALKMVGGDVSLSKRVELLRYQHCLTLCRLDYHGKSVSN